MNDYLINQDLKILNLNFKKFLIKKRIKNNKKE